jgi:hypothetical protein
MCVLLATVKAMVNWDALVDIPGARSCGDLLVWTTHVRNAEQALIITSMWMDVSRTRPLPLSMPGYPQACQEFRQQLWTPPSLSHSTRHLTYHRSRPPARCMHAALKAVTTTVSIIYPLLCYVPGEHLGLVQAAHYAQQNTSSQPDYVPGVPELPHVLHHIRVTWVYR